MSTTPAPIAKLLRHYPYPLVVTDLETRTILGANQPAYELLSRAPPALDVVPASEVVSPADRPAVEASMELLASGALEGYQALRLLRKGDGQELSAHISVRRADLGGYKLGLVAIGAGGAKVPWPPTEDHVTIAGIVTDHDWTIEMMSSDIEAILGVSPENYKGAPLLGLLQPWDVQNLMSAVGRVSADGGGATLRVHLRNHEGRWQDVLLLVVAMCQHSPPRLGVAVTSPEAGAGIFPDHHQEFASRGLDAVSGADQFRSCPRPEGFSTRQSEILTRLLRGERVSGIADDLYLSPSTVRNHLTAIYRKFGVHSQAELLAKLLRGPSPP